MKTDSPLYNKSFDFAIRILDMSEFLLGDSDKFIGESPKRLSYACKTCVKQITRSGTSIVANVSEGTEAQSKADLSNKNSIALKEAKETKTWLDIMHRKEYISTNMYESMLADLSEILRMLGASIRTLRKSS